MGSNSSSSSDEGQNILSSKSGEGHPCGVSTAINCACDVSMMSALVRGGGREEEGGEGGAQEVPPRIRRVQGGTDVAVREWAEKEKQKDSVSESRFSSLSSSDSSEAVTSLIPNQGGGGEEEEEEKEREERGEKGREGRGRCEFWVEEGEKRGRGEGVTRVILE